jgi:hypothetical protein
MKTFHKSFFIKKSVISGYDPASQVFIKRDPEFGAEFAFKRFSVIDNQDLRFEAPEVMVVTEIIEVSLLGVIRAEVGPIINQRSLHLSVRNAGSVFRYKIVKLPLDFKKDRGMFLFPIISPYPEFFSGMNAVQFLVITSIINTVEIDAADRIFLIRAYDGIFIMIKIDQQVLTKFIKVVERDKVFIFESILHSGCVCLYYSLLIRSDMIRT